jgi:hypothetical protein
VMLQLRCKLANSPYPGKANRKHAFTKRQMKHE